jgi:hypothetical protein
LTCNVRPSISWRSFVMSTRVSCRLFIRTLRDVFTACKPTCVSSIFLFSSSLRRPYVFWLTQDRTSSTQCLMVSFYSYWMGCIEASIFSWCVSILAFIFSWVDAVLDWWMSVQEFRVSQRTSDFSLLASILASIISWLSSILAFVLS